MLPGLELRFYDPATGEWLRSHQESETALRAAEAELRQSEAARQEAQAEAARLRAILERLADAG